MAAIYFLILLLLMMYKGCESRNEKKISENRYQGLDDHDPIAITKCDAVCRGYYFTEKEQCHRQCMVKDDEKLGACPKNFEGVSVFAQACLVVCRKDRECPGFEKCCRHSCGSTCQPAVGLNEQLGLPPVPVNVTAREHRGNSLVQINWAYPTSSFDNKNDLYLIECRSHFGRYYNSDSLGPWRPLLEATQVPAVVRGLLVPAHWYIFRVTGVNENGTRGASDATAPFILSKAPSKPNQPKRLTVTNVREMNGSISANVRWGRPKSDVPIKKYKVFWSRRLPGHNPKNASEDLFVQQRTVPKNKQQYQLDNLEKNEIYYIQVQALAAYGRQKLKGDMAEMFFNTSNFHDQQATKHRKGHHNRDKT